MQVSQLHISLTNDSKNIQEIKKQKDTVQRPPQLPAKFPSPPPLPEHFTILTNEQIQSVEKFVFFVGYGRSGHSVVASMMDAHPNMIIADEYYLFGNPAGSQLQARLHSKLDLFNELYLNSYTCAKSGRRNSLSNHTKSYHLEIKGMWQGQFDQLKVIGDKAGGATAMKYHDNPERFKRFYDRLGKTVGVPLHAIHVVRNPFDMIATVALYQASGQPDDLKVHASVDEKFSDLGLLTTAVDIVLKKAHAVYKMKSDSKLGLKLLEIHLDDLISNPRHEILSVCRFLEVECSEDYLKACEGKTFSSTSKSRDKVVWTNSLRTKINTAINKYDFFSRYTFD